MAAVAHRHPLPDSRRSSTHTRLRPARAVRPPGRSPAGELEFVASYAGEDQAGAARAGVNPGRCVVGAGAPRRGAACGEAAQQQAPG
jgi:hypothetical protein